MSRFNVLQIKNQLQGKKGNQPISAYLQQIKQLTDTLAAVSSWLDDEDIILYTINGLPPEFDAFSTTIRLHPTQISLNELHDLLTIEDQHISLKQMTNQLS